MTLSRSLAGLIRSLPVERADLDAAERYVRDWLGSFVAGRATPPGRALLAYGGETTDVESNAFLAGALSHVTETDDLHRGSITHPGCVVVPVALLLGRALEADGRRVLESVLAGYEAMLRVGEAVGPGHYRMFHNTATAGVFGSAAAAASLLGLDEDRWVWAFGSAGTQAAGLWQFNADGTMSKHLHAGHAAQSGLRAALLAERGFTGAEEILEGDRGFFVALCPDPDPGAVLRKAHGWKLAETSLKPYPCCRHTHPAVDVALQLRSRLVGNGSPAGIRSVRVSTYDAALSVTDDPSPRTPYEAKFSMQFCVATALVNGTPGLLSFAEEKLTDGLVRRVLESTSLVADRTFNRRYPGRWGARIDVETNAGDTYSSERGDALGDPEAPMDSGALDAKIEGLFEFGGLPAPDARALLDASGALPGGGPPVRLPFPRAE